VSVNVDWGTWGKNYPNFINKIDNPHLTIASQEPDLHVVIANPKITVISVLRSGTMLGIIRKKMYNKPV